MDKKQVIALVIGALVVGWGASYVTNKPMGETETATDKKDTLNDYIALKINGKSYTKSHIEQQIQAATAVGGQPTKFDEMPEALQKNITESFVRHEILRQEAESRDMMDDPEVRERAAFMKNQAMIDIFLNRKIDDLVPAEKIKAAYDEKVKNMTQGEEMQAAHILVENEEEAKAIIAEINGGKDFSEVAKAKSKDVGSGQNGGDLGFFTKEQMIPEFSNAAFALKPGEVSAQPVKTAFGWHIIKAGERRPVSAPPFEQMEPQLKNEMVGAAMQEYLNSLVGKSQVSFYTADGHERPIFENLLKPAPDANAPGAAPTDAVPAAGEAAPANTETPAEAGDTSAQ